MCVSTENHYTCGHIERWPSTECVYKQSATPDDFDFQTTPEELDIKKWKSLCQQNSTTEVNEKKDECTKCRSEEKAKEHHNRITNDVQDWEIKVSKGL